MGSQGGAHRYLECLFKTLTWLLDTLEVEFLIIYTVEIFLFILWFEYKIIIMKHTLKKQKQRGKKGNQVMEGISVQWVRATWVFFHFRMLLTGPHPPIAFLSSARAENPVSSVQLPEELQPPSSVNDLASYAPIFSVPSLMESVQVKFSPNFPSLYKFGTFIHLHGWYLYLSLLIMQLWATAIFNKPLLPPVVNFSWGPSDWTKATS